MKTRQIIFYTTITASLMLFSSPMVLAEKLASKAAKAHLLATLTCPGCDLSKLDLSAMDLRNAKLKGANLSGANLRDTNLRGADLSRAILRDVVLSDTLLGGANLKNADLSDIDIDKVFESTEIIGTQLEGAKFALGVICGPAPTKGGWGCQQL